MREVTKWCGAVFLFCGIVCIWYFYGGHEAALGSGPNKFDAIGVLFSGLAFAGMLVTLLLQRQELIDNRNEFKRTADANERMAANGLKQIQVQWLLEKKKQILKIMEAREAEFAAFDDEEHAEMIKNLYLSELEKIDQEYTRITS